MTGSNRCEHRGEALSPMAFVGISALYLSASAVFAGDLISAEKTVVMLWPKATTSFSSSSSPGFENVGFDMLTLPFLMNESFDEPIELKRSAPHPRMGERWLRRVNTPRANEFLRAPNNVPRVPRSRSRVRQSILDSSIEIEKREIQRRGPVLIWSTLPHQPLAIENQGVSADVPRMTKEALIEDAAEAFAQRDQFGDVNPELEYIFENTGEFSGEFGSSATKVSNSFQIAPVQRPHYFGELHCLAEAIYFEARGEKAEGQQAVAEVIINRVNSEKFPDKICEVVTQGGSDKNRCQFSFNCDGLPEAISEKAAYAKVRMLAFRAMQGEISPLVGNATYFHAKWANPRWADAFEKTAEIGNHVFYQERVN